MPSSLPARALLLQVIAYIAFISLGLPDAVNGVAWPSVRHTFGLPHAAFGAIAVLATLSYLVSSMLTPRLLHRFGVGLLLLASTALVALGLLGYSTAPAWALFLVGALLNGTGSGAIDTSLNAYAAKHFSLRSMNWLHGFYMVGAGLGPGIMTAVLAQQLSWRVGYALLAGILAMLTLLFLVTRRHWEDDDEAAPGAAPAGTAVTPPSQAAPSEPPASAPLREALRSRTVNLQVGLFFLHTAMEVTTGLWCYTYLVEHRNHTPAFAGTLTTTYWTVFAAGRFLLGAISHHVGPVGLVRFGVLLATAGALLFAFTPMPVAGFGLACIGLGLAPVFPTLMSCTPARVGDHLSPTAVGFQVSASAVGAALMPALAGLIATQLSLALLPPLITILGVLLFAVHELLLSATRSRSCSS